MGRPRSLWEQYRGKAYAALMRGSGVWLPQPHPCALEPPCPAYDRESVSSWDCFVNDWDGPFQRSLLSRLFSPSSQASLLLPEETWGNFGQLVPVVIERYPEDEPTLPKAEQFLLSLRSVHRPLAFEVLGLGPRPTFDTERALEVVKAGGRIREAINGWTEPTTVVQFVADRQDAPHVQRQLLAHYPNSAVIVRDSLTDGSLDPGHGVRHDEAFVAVLALSTGFCFPLKTFSRLDPDPLGVAIAAMEQLDRDQWALIQVLFCRARQDWSAHLSVITRDPYKGEYFFDDLSDRVLASKFASPLFAVSVRILASDQAAFRHLVGWEEQFAAPPQDFAHLGDEEEREKLADAILDRSTHRPGMILNLQELAGLVHLPNSTVFSERLGQVKTRTRPAPAVTDPTAVVLGTNVHQGIERPAVIPTELRLQHCYLTGASGTGKSTLLLHMICQDMAQGSGLAVIDPHGDLIADVLSRIPAERIADVVYFNATDRDYPVGLNILQVRDGDERERVVAETVGMIHRFYADSWGPQLELLLTKALDTIARFKGLTLEHVRQILVDEPFRAQVLAKLTDPRLRQFWELEYPQLPSTASNPILNKLARFLDSSATRNILCQKAVPGHPRIDFDEVLKARKILLVNLSTGLMGHGVLEILGTLIVSKLLTAALRRAAIPREHRIPFYLYVDEFQNFANLSTIRFDTILVEARKFKLALVMANQYLSQVPPDVREALYGAGTLISFRVGVNDAQMMARQFGGFTADEVLNLSRGEALVRPEMSGKSYNLKTLPPPPMTADHSADVIAASRAAYARPRADVERDFIPPAPPPRPTPPAAQSSRPPQASPKPAPDSQTQVAGQNGPVSPPPRPQPTRGTCPQCGAELVDRTGPHGPFVGCSGFPTCRFTRKLQETTEQGGSPPRQTESSPANETPPSSQPDPSAEPEATADPPGPSPAAPKKKPKAKPKAPPPPPMSSGEGSLEDYVR